MKNLWPEKFEPESLPPPKILLQEQGNLLTKITGGMVQAEVAPLREIDQILNSLKNDFAYNFDILGPFLDNYRFTLLKLSHDIAIYPVKMLVNEEVSKELKLQVTSGGGAFVAASPEEFEEILQRIFQSDRLKKVIGSIIALSK